MKKEILLSIAALVLICSTAVATITLNSQYVRSFQTGGVTTETDNTASATTADISFPAQSLVVTVQLGTMSPGFVQGKEAPIYSVVIDAKGGNVTGPLGNLKLTAAQQNAVKTVLTDLQNQIETFPGRAGRGPRHGGGELKTMLAALLLLISLPLCAATKKQRAMNLTVYAAAEFDGATTVYLLNHCPAGVTCNEGNSIMAPVAKSPALLVVMAGSGWAVNRIARKLLDEGHPKYARGLQLFVIGAHVLAGAHNLHAMR